MGLFDPFGVGAALHRYPRLHRGLFTFNPFGIADSKALPNRDGYGAERHLGTNFSDEPKNVRAPIPGRQEMAGDYTGGSVFGHDGRRRGRRRAAGWTARDGRRRRGRKPRKTLGRQGNDDDDARRDGPRRRAANRAGPGCEDREKRGENSVAPPLRSVASVRLAASPEIGRFQGKSRRTISGPANIRIKRKYKS
jgi:hypothetical protein